MYRYPCSSWVWGSNCEGWSPRVVSKASRSCQVSADEWISRPLTALKESCTWNWRSPRDPKVRFIGHHSSSFYWRRRAARAVVAAIWGERINRWRDPKKALEEAWIYNPRQHRSKIVHGWHWPALCCQRWDEGSRWRGWLFPFKEDFYWSSLAREKGVSWLRTCILSLSSPCHWNLIIKGDEETLVSQIPSERLGICRSRERVQHNLHMSWVCSPVIQHPAYHPLSTSIRP